ncbi:oocyte zinc finger protein XlCOF15-like [Culicoides brevitarsis]|uniref:oocyte zinc finger protein XlCOF15-like n=1 Tax=Culicoides brevitarsis TaxID=469753 RepID=UPI00307B7A95
MLSIDEPLSEIDVRDLLFFNTVQTDVISLSDLSDYLQNPPEFELIVTEKVQKIPPTRKNPPKKRKKPAKKLYKRRKNKECHICEKQFTTTTKLNIHILVHSGSRPFKCTKCDKSFSQEFNLKRHEMVHQPQRQRKFQCHVCGLFYLEKHHLTDHILACHSLMDANKKIVCDICKKTVKNKNSYRTHRYRHVTFMENEI